MGDLVVTKHPKAHLKPDNTCTDGDADSNEQDVAQAPLVDGSINGEHNLWSNSAKPNKDDDTGEVHIDRGSHNADSLQESLQLANECESAEALERDSDHRGDLQTKDSHSPEGTVDQSIGLKEDVECANEGDAVSHFEGVKQKSTTLQEEVSVSKVALMGDQKNIQNCNMGQAHVSGNRRSSKNASFSSITSGSSRSHFTIPQPFSLATYERALTGGRFRENGRGQNALRSNGASEDSHSKVPQVSRQLGASLPVAKLKSSGIIKNLDDPLKRPTLCASPEHPDEDAMSISSVRSCSLAPKAKTSRFTNTSTFNFPSDARAEKRKEFYLNLQERYKAKEEELKHNQAKAKKEKEDEIKLLRKSMTFRASPVPRFYQEGPPPRAELAKAPTTRAKSPNFTRRDSHSGSGACTRQCNARFEPESRSSLSPQKLGKYDNREVLDKENQRKRCVSESPIEQPEEGKMTSTGGGAKVLQLLDIETSVTAGDFEEVPVEVRDPPTVAPELTMSDKEEKAPFGVQEADSEHATSNGEEDNVYVDKTNSCKGASNGSIGGQGPKESKALEGHDNMNAGVLSLKDTAAPRSVNSRSFV